MQNKNRPIVIHLNCSCVHNTVFCNNIVFSSKINNFLLKLTKVVKLTHNPLGNESHDQLAQMPALFEWIY